MSTESSTETRWRELAFRTNNGLEVTLLWKPATQGLKVCVCDQQLGAYFEIEPAPQRALDVFYHPYSWASRSVVYFEDSRLAA